MERHISLWHRVTAIGLTMAVHVLVVIALLLQPSWMAPLRDVRRLEIFDLLPEPAPEPEPPPIPKKPVIEKQKPVVTPEEVPPPPVATVVPFEPQAIVALPIEAPAPTAPEPPPPPPSTALPIDWFQKPTPAELRQYVPSRAPAGTGVIQCQTAANFRVRNCRIIAETPRGSGLGTALRRASRWFLIKPPVVDGQPDIGAWVTIKVNYTQE